MIFWWLVGRVCGGWGVGVMWVWCCSCPLVEGVEVCRIGFFGEGVELFVAAVVRSTRSGVAGVDRGCGGVGCGGCWGGV